MGNTKDFEKFDSKVIKKARRTSRVKIINALLKEYYDETLDQAQRNPKSFSEDASSAEEDPKAIARQYAEQYRDVLTKKERTSLEFLYAHYIQDQEEIERESGLDL